MRSLLTYIDAVNNNDYDAMANVFDEALEHRILPKSLERPVLTKKLYLEYWRSVMGLFETFEVRFAAGLNEGYVEADVVFVYLLLFLPRQRCLCGFLCRRNNPFIASFWDLRKTVPLPFGSISRRRHIVVFQSFLPDPRSGLFFRVSLDWDGTPVWTVFRLRALFALVRSNCAVGWWVSRQRLSR